MRVARNSTRLSRQNEEAESPTHSKEHPKEKDSQVLKPPVYSLKPKSASGLIQPLMMQFNILLQVRFIYLTKLNALNFTGYSISILRVYR